MPAIPEEIRSLPRSGIRAVMDLAWASPEPVLRLEVGQPDATPPDHVAEAMTDAITRGDTGYTPNAGIPRLREACATKLAAVNGVRRDPAQVLVTAGSMEAIILALLGLAEPGDQVLVPDPGWPNYEMAARIAHLEPVRYRLDRGDGYRPDWDRVEAQLTPRTRILVINSPSNPLGVTLDRDDHHRLLELAERAGLWVVSDECYDQILYEGDPISPAAHPAGADRVVSVHSFSKTYAMTGLRVGYLSAPPKATEVLTKMQEAVVACVNGPAQWGAVAALEGPQDFVTERLETYRSRRDRALSVTADLGLAAVTPRGAFYLWLPDIVADSTAFATELVTRHGVAVAPGRTFGPSGEGALRVALATAAADIEEGLRRIADAL